jgi:hypothetical protein
MEAFNVGRREQDDPYYERHSAFYAPTVWPDRPRGLLWTNDRWTSTLRRVLPLPAAARGPVRRRSVARFLDCEPDQVIECIPSCCGPGNPPKYQPVQAGEWLMAKILHGRQAPGATRDSAGRQGS